MITFIILTYKRNDLLSNLINQFKEFDKHFDIELFIFDNNPENNFNINNLLSRNISIKYIKRDFNIGADLNFFYSLKYVSNLSIAKYTTIISDDDLITYDYLKEINNFENSQLTFDYILCRNMIIYNFQKNLFTLRSYKNTYYEILDKHTTITGTTYSNIFLKNVFNFHFTNEENLKLFSYPMTFTFLFSKNYSLINKPCLIHTVENEMFWGSYNHFEKFYYNRLYMYQLCFCNNLISNKDFKFLTKRLITRNSIIYYFKLYKHNNLIIYNKLLSLLIPLIIRNILNVTISFSKKLIINVKNTVSSYSK